MHSNLPGSTSFGAAAQLGRAAVQWLQGLPGARVAASLLHEVQKDDIPGMAAEMAYRFLFALFPLLLVLTASFGIAAEALELANPLGRLLAELGPLLPGGVAEAVLRYGERLAENGASGRFLTVGFLGAVWGAAGGVGTLIKGLNRAYAVSRPRAFWKRQLLAIALTVSLPPVAVALLLVGVLGRLVASWLETVGIAGPLPDLIALLRGPVSALLLLLGLSGIYHVLPNIRHRYLEALPGAVLATAGWFVATRGLEWYLTNLTDYEVAYGAIGAGMALMLWFYLVSFVVLLGAELNAVLARSVAAAAASDS